MQHVTGLRPVPVGAIVVVLVALISSACGGGVRPTLTGERLPEPTVESASGVEPGAETPTPGETSSEPTAVEQVDGLDPDADSEAAPGADIDPASSNAAALDPAPNPDGTARQFVVEVIESFPHDPAAFTQGLELHDGLFIESTGVYGESELRRVLPETGEVTQSIAVPAEFFAEGVTKVDDQLIQLTWREGTAFYYDATDFSLQKEVTYAGEGWGICYDGDRLIMTNGSPVLTFRDPTTFEEIGRAGVTLDGQEVARLNEAECVNGQVWANIWQTSLIVRIDPASGLVTAVVDTAVLQTPENVDAGVLNGIAWDETTQSFYVTGKNWPTMYRVNFVAEEAG